MTGRTGEACQTPGPYKCNSQTSIIVVFKRGQKFPGDPVNGRATSWSLVRQ
jgi:hypothetical protein